MPNSCKYNLNLKLWSLSIPLADNNEGKPGQEGELRCLLEGMNGSFQDRECEVEWSGELIANYCIANKLKTSFGKAQETLGAYERTMRTLANNFGKQTAPLQPEKIRQARNFLVIFDCLEKAMYQVSTLLGSVCCKRPGEKKTDD